MIIFDFIPDRVYDKLVHRFPGFFYFLFDLLSLFFFYRNGNSGLCFCYRFSRDLTFFLFIHYIFLCEINLDYSTKYIFYYSLISPAHLNAYFATITAIISLIIAAATIVPDTIVASDGSKEDRVVVAIPVNTKETPE